MSAASKHTIEKVFLEVDTKEEYSAREIQRNAGEFVQDFVLGYLEDYFAKFETKLADSTVRMDKCSIQLDLEKFELTALNSRKIFESELVGQVEQQLEEAFESFDLRVDSSIESTRNKTNTQLLSPQSRKIEALLYFLRHGSRAWWISESSELSQLLEETDVQKTIQSNRELVRKFYSDNRTNHTIRSRVIEQFSDKVVGEVLGCITVASINPSLVSSLKWFTRKEAWWLAFELAGLGDLGDLGDSKQHRSNNLDDMPDLGGLKNLVFAAKGSSKNNLEPTGKVIKSNADEIRLNESYRHSGQPKIPTALNPGLSKEGLKSRIKSETIKRLINGRSSLGQILLILQNVLGITRWNQFLSEENTEVWSDLGRVLQLSGASNQAAEQMVQALDTVQTKIGQMLDSSLKVGSNSEISKDIRDTISSKESNGIVDAESTLPNILPIETPTRKEGDNVQDAAFYADNAGVILLHPFFKTMLKKLELLEPNGLLVDPEMTCHLLHYLATGEECAMEHEMTFEKFLCGLSEEDTLKRDLSLPEVVKEEADNVLKATLEHWKALKSNSIPFLQNGFLKRPAKILMEDQVMRITFERNAYDLLLDKLPWTIGMVKVPWREQLIFIEW